LLFWFAQHIAVLPICLPSRLRFIPIKTAALSVRAVPDKTNTTGPSDGDLKVAVCGSGPGPSKIIIAFAIVFSFVESVELML
jgi:hypothetical protein